MSLPRSRRLEKRNLLVNEKPCEGRIHTHTHLHPSTDTRCECTRAKPLTHTVTLWVQNQRGKPSPQANPKSVTLPIVMLMLGDHLPHHPSAFSPSHPKEEPRYIERCHPETQKENGVLDGGSFVDSKPSYLLVLTAVGRHATFIHQAPQTGASD